MKLIKGIIFGVDVFDGLAWFVLLTFGFWHAGLSIPNGHFAIDTIMPFAISVPLPAVHLHPFSISLWWWHVHAVPRLVIAVMIASLAAVLPDLDMIPYKLIRKNRQGLFVVIAFLAYAGCLALFAAFGKPFFIWLAITDALATTTALVALEKARRRASHWPIGHHPLPVIVISFGLTWRFAMDFDPQHLLYYELLVMPLIVLHFLHDAIQPQGFPLLSPFTDNHYRVTKWPMRVPNEVVRKHYRDQAARTESLSSKEDALWRADKVTPLRIFLFLLAGSATLATLWFL